MGDDCFVELLFLTASQLWPQSFLKISYALAAKPTRVTAAAVATANKSISNPLFDLFFPFITEGKTWIIPAIIGMFFFIKKERKKAVFLI